MFISVQEKATPGFKISKDCCTLLLGGNASGGDKIKPLMVYHSEKPQACKDYSKGVLLVVQKSNKRAQTTANLFDACFASELCHDL
jgi:hypothetical protein